MAGKRNGNEEFGGGSGQETPAQKKAQEYVRALLAEKGAIDQNKHPLAGKLLEQEITRAQTEGKGPLRDNKFVDVYREKPAKVIAKVVVPIKEHPKFNFVGKLLGPKGSSLKRLQEETMCRMAILGRGSMRDREKEEELRNSGDPKYSHLTDDLHVEVSALGPPAEAYARIAFALTEVQKYLIPDGTDDISAAQFQEMEMYEDHPVPKGRPGPPGGGGGPGRRPGMRGPPQARQSGPARGSPRMPPTGGPRGIPGKSNVMSILDRARQSSMDDSYNDNYDESFESEPYNNFSSGPSRQGFGGGNRFGASNFENDFYGDSSNNGFSGGAGENQRWRPFKAPGGAQSRSDQPRYRAAPYARGGK